MYDEKGITKYGDFGSAEIVTPENDLIAKTGGTYQFLAPECCDRNPSSPQIFS